MTFSKDLKDAMRSSDDTIEKDLADISGTVQAKKNQLGNSASSLLEKGKEFLSSSSKIIGEKAETTTETAQELYSTAKEKTADGYETAKDKAGELYNTASTNFKENAEIAKQNASDAAVEIDKQVKAKPWQAVGIAAAVGLVLGALLGRNDKK